MDTHNDFTDPVNLRTPEEFQIRELVNKILEMIGSCFETVFRSLCMDDLRQGQPDIKAAIELLGWEPKIKLVDFWRKPSFFAPLRKEVGGKLVEKNP